MKCKDFEREIYLYSTLSAAEKQKVNDHLETCKACRQLLAMVQQTEALVATAAIAKPQPENFSRLTNNIMQAVEKEKTKPASWINFSFVKYAMAGASLMLIIAFGVESFSTGELQLKQYSTAKSVTLSSTSLGKLYRSKKEKSQPSVYACVKNGDCHILIENFKKEL